MAGLLLRQIVAVTRINLLSLPQRLETSLAAAVGIGVVVFVLLGALALNNGFEQTLRGSGSDGVAIVLRSGANSEINSSLSREQQLLLAEAPAVLRRDGVPLSSNELVVIVDGIKSSTKTKTNLPLRGVGPNALAVRDGFKLTRGRMFAPGSNEIVIGSRVIDDFDGFDLGKEIHLGSNSWRVVGEFDADGSVFESELWADVTTVQTLFHRGDNVQSLRIRLDGRDGLARLRAFNRADARLGTDVHTEKDFYAHQSQMTTDLITKIGKPLAILMAIGALAGAMNAMYSSVAHRSGEIMTLRTIGFGGLATFAGTLVESVVLALFGGMIGIVFALIVYSGMSASTLGGNFTEVAFKLSLAPRQILESSVWAMAMGLLGGALPAWRAARQPLLSRED